MCAFVERSGLQEVQVTVQTPFPGTPLRRRLAQEDRLLGEDDWDRCTLFDVTFEPDGLTPGELRDGLRSAIERLYTDGAVEARRRRFLAQRRSGG